MMTVWVILFVDYIFHVHRISLENIGYFHWEKYFLFLVIARKNTASKTHDRECSVLSNEDV